MWKYTIDELIADCSCSENQYFKKDYNDRIISKEQFEAVQLKIVSCSNV